MFRLVIISQVGMTGLYKTQSVSGKTVLITGASAGIGEACAFLFAEQGANLILVARRLEKLNAVRDSILTMFPAASIRTEVCDVSQLSDVDSLMNRLGNDRVDILVNNAGLALGTESGDQVPIEDVKTMFDTNVIGVMSLVNRISRQMRDRNSGDIVNIGSVAGSDHYAGGAIYCATKSAIDAYTDCLRMDMADTDIRVIGVNPGLVSGTEFSLVRFRGDSQMASTPYKGIECLTAMDVADQVVYAVTRPRNVQMAQMRSYCTNQGHAKYVIARK